MKALVFDAYGTLFDVFSVTSLCELLFPGKGAALAVTWRSKQLQYSLLRSLMERYADFWQVTQDALVYATKALRLELTAENRDRLMDAYRTLQAFPDVKPGLEQLKSKGMALAILSNGAPPMLKSAVEAAELKTGLDAVLSVDVLKMFKPRMEVYALVTKEFSCQPADVVFVSSNRWDAMGATTFGFRTVWINRTGNPDEYTDRPPVAVASNLTGVLSVR